MSDYLDTNGLQRVWGKFKENISSYKEIENVDIANFDDGQNLPLKSLEVAIEPVQIGSGEPSPTNIRPIYGHQTEIITRYGANMFGGEMELGSIDDTTGEEVPDNTCLRNKALYTINVSGGVPFYGVVPFDYNGIKYYFYDRFGNFISCSGWQSKGVYTPPNDAVIMRIVLSSDYGTTYNNDISINYPSTITTYQSFSGHANFILFSDGTNPLTVYGGKLDVVNGVLTVDRAFVDLGTLNWQTQGNPNTFQAVISDMLTPSNNIMCSHYPTTPASTSAGNMPDKSIKTYGNSSAKYIIVKDSSYSDVATIQTAMNGVQLVYELDTPQTIQLTPTIIKSLQGANNFFASTGEIIRMEYQPDNIVGELRSEIQSLDYDIFIVNCINNNGSWVTDVTESELRKAVNENKKIFMAYKNRLVPFIEMTSYTSYPNTATFSCADFGQTDLINNKIGLTKTTLEVSFSDSSVSEDIESLNLQLTV